MENMDKGLTVPKWVLINWPKIPQMPQNLSVQILCPSPKFGISMKKRLHWASVVRDHSYKQTELCNILDFPDYCNISKLTGITQYKLAAQLFRIDPLICPPYTFFLQSFQKHQMLTITRLLQ